MEGGVQEKRYSAGQDIELMKATEEEELKYPPTEQN